MDGRGTGDAFGALEALKPDAAVEGGRWVWVGVEVLVSIRSFSSLTAPYLLSNESSIPFPLPSAPAADRSLMGATADGAAAPLDVDVMGGAPICECHRGGRKSRLTVRKRKP